MRNIQNQFKKTEKMSSKRSKKYKENAKIKGEKI